MDVIVFANMPMQLMSDLIIKAREKGIGVHNVDTEMRLGVIANCTQINGVAGLNLFYQINEQLAWKGLMLI